MRSSFFTSPRRNNGISRNSIRRGLAVETMENRMLLAADVELLDNGTLAIRSDDEGSSIQVQSISREEIGVQTDDARAIFPRKEVLSIQVKLGNGDDKFFIDPAAIPESNGKRPALEVDLGGGNNDMAVGERGEVPEAPALERARQATKEALSLATQYFENARGLADQRAKLADELQAVRDRAEKEFFTPALELARDIQDDGDPRVEEVQRLLNAGESLLQESLVPIRELDAARTEMIAPLVDSLVELDKIVDVGDVDIEVPPPGARAAGPSCSDFENGTVLFSVIFIGGAGNDFISLSPTLTLNAFLDGNGGNDTLIGGGGHDRIEGGDGN